MASAVLYLKDIGLTFGGDALLEGANLTVNPRARIALVGRNGSGKSTLMKIAAGLVEADQGERFLQPGASVTYLPQEPDMSGYETVGDYVASGCSPVGTAGDYERYIDDLGLRASQKTPELSGGEARRAAIARALASDPDILLADEPTNHLDIGVIKWLENELRKQRCALVLISHDRRLLENLTTETIWIDRGKTRELNRGFSEFEAWRDKLLEEEETSLHKLDRKIVAEEHWVRYGVTARRKRNVRRMAALSALRKQRLEHRKAPGSVKFTTKEADRSGKRVIKAENIAKSYGDRQIVENFSIEIGRGDRIGLVGPNGAGKTTLLNLLIGALPPDAGSIEHGANLQILSLDQNRQFLTPEARVADAITDGRGDFVTIGDQKKHAATYLQDFLFAPEQWRAPVSSLSGGERGRLALAATLAKSSNLLVLDEPTNDLDLETLDLLEELLADYQGTLLLVSHDRSFLDRLATSTLAPDPTKPGKWIEYVGGYSDMLAQQDFTLQQSSLHKQKKVSNKQAAPKTTAQKLSYKEKFALEQLPARITSLGKEITTLKVALADPKLFEKDATAFNTKATALEKAETDLAAAEEEWLELEMKRETLEG